MGERTFQIMGEAKTKENGGGRKSMGCRMHVKEAV